MSDQSDVTELERLCSVPLPKRDDQWERDLWRILPESQIALENDRPQYVLDGWPYMLITAKGTEPAKDLLAWLSRRGVGLVLNLKDPAPDYVFSYGMIWSYAETGSFVTDYSHSNEEAFVLEAGQKILAGPPDAKFLPDYVRKTIREFWLQQQVLAPKILVVSKDRKHYDLCFSTESLGNPKQSEHAGIAEAISWFLPPGTSVVVTSEIGLPPFHLL